MEHHFSSLRKTQEWIRPRWWQSRFYLTFLTTCSSILSSKYNGFATIGTIGENWWESMQHALHLSRQAVVQAWLRAFWTSTAATKPILSPYWWWPLRKRRLWATQAQTDSTRNVLPQKTESRSNSSLGLTMNFTRSLNKKSKCMKPSTNSSQRVSSSQITWRIQLLSIGRAWPNSRLEDQATRTFRSREVWPFAPWSFTYSLVYFYGSASSFSLLKSRPISLPPWSSNGPKPSSNSSRFWNIKEQLAPTQINLSD